MNPPEIPIPEPFHQPPSTPPPMHRPPRSLAAATRGPIVLIVLGILLALDQAGAASFGRTWPALLILFGLFKLAEYMGARNA